jgi:hypothetical protein
MRFRHLATTAFAASATIAGAACSGGGGTSSGPPSEGTPPVPIVVSTTFPAAAATASGGGTAWAIVGVRTTLSGSGANAYGSAYDTLQVAVTFAQDVSIALPARGAMLAQPAQLGLFVGLKTRGNGGYGDCRNAPVLDYSSDPGVVPGRLLDGNYNILSASQGGPLQNGIAGGNPLDEALTGVSGHVITQTFPLLSIDALSSTGPPQVDVVVAAFNGTRATEPTDCVPESGAIVSGG